MCTVCALAVIVSPSTWLARTTHRPRPETAMRRILGVLAGLVLIGCRDTLQPAGPRVPLPRAAIAPTTAPPTNECANPPAGTIWCDDFEVDRLSSYFEQ